MNKTPPLALLMSVALLAPLAVAAPTATSINAPKLPARAAEQCAPQHTLLS